MNQQLIEKYMRTLDLTREQAVQLIQDDKQIDKGKDLFPLTKDQEKASKQARITTGAEQRKPTERVKKVDDDKLFLMNLLNKVLQENASVSNFESVNNERETIFCFNDRKFKIVLSAPRK
jgi:hypothetical protein